MCLFPCAGVRPSTAPLSPASPRTPSPLHDPSQAAVDGDGDATTEQPVEMIGVAGMVCVVRSCPAAHVFACNVVCMQMCQPHVAC